jgi:hypothetical protein
VDIETSGPTSPWIIIFPLSPPQSRRLLHRIEDRLGELVVVARKPVDLLDVEDGVLPRKRNTKNITKETFS